ncbi:MAG: IS66 family insertion sequence element accessory protein TnpB [Bryobacteraceae bacterium]
MKHLHFLESYKRLDRGRFRWPEAEGGKVLLSQEELTLLLGGIDLAETRRRAWHRMTAPAEKKTA